jgi:regulator of sigma E protease
MPFLLSAGYTLLAFAVLISVLVFFHEMGHLLVGKYFGVKVLRFSIGFGPRLWGFQRGETEYRLSALPLGGYVKFAGDVPGEELPPEDRGRGYLEQPPLRKAAIAFAGPAANFVLAVALSILINALPHQDWAPLVGFVIPNSPAAAAGLKTGDRIVSMDGAPVRGFNHFRELISASRGRPAELVVLREGREQSLRITPAIREEKNPLQTVKTGRIGIVRTARKAEVTVLGDDSPAGRAGLKTFDLITKADGKQIDSWEQLVSLLAARGPAPLPLEVLRRREVSAPGATLWAQEPVRLTLPSPSSDARPLGVAHPDAATPYGLECADLTIFAVQPGSAAAEAGLLRGDRLVSIAGHPALFWADDVETARRAAGVGPLLLAVRRGGKLVELTVRQHLKSERDEAGVRVKVPELGAQIDGDIFDGGKDEIVSVRFPLAEAVGRGVLGTGDAIRAMALGIARIVTGDISSEAIGGPLMIADVSRRALDEGPLAFLSIMALISISLGLMNLIPIPVLDGFHILSAAIEAVRRRPLSLRFREVANMVGVLLVLSLMLFALKNDVVRKFFD